MKNLKTSTESQFPHISRGLGRGGDKKSAFTLAEVLITLGVIGVVAAMTIPTLIHNYQKTVYVNQLKKSYSILEQAFQKMLADDGVQKLSDTSVWASKNNAECNYSTTSYTTDNCKAFVNSLNKYIKIIGVEKYGNKVAYLKGTGTNNYTNYYSLVLSDGTIVMLYVFSSAPTSSACNQIKSQGGNMCSSSGLMSIDINGRKGPNTDGRDVFWFYLSDEGKLNPHFGKDYAIWYSPSLTLNNKNNTSYWRNDNKRCGNADGTMPNTVYGSGCAARIMEEGWKMNY